MNCCASPAVPSGTFYQNNDLSSTPVTVPAYRLDKYEVTVGRFRKFVDAYRQDMIPAYAGRNLNNPNDSGWDPAWNAQLPATVDALKTELQCDGLYQTWTGNNDNRPMNCTTWYEAEAFCIWDGGRLPEASESYFAAAGGTEQRVYPWGTSAPGADATLAVYNCYYNATGPGTCTGVINIAPVGSVIAGDGRWGQSDLAGNLMEWSRGTFGSYRRRHGGDYRSGAPLIDTISSETAPPTVRLPYLGFRCARPR
ncbi:MAG: SUMF1/EgtB/PvdO family nonheme iron enzyme [Polyangiaceae bacterium]|nr:SUMF1/EgtB/PvdO family nonheme iron enzyme [Polyangiaceae bacterium]